MYVCLMGNFVARMEERYPARYMTEVASQLVPHKVLERATNILARGFTNDADALMAFGQTSDLLYTAAEGWRIAEKAHWILRRAPPTTKEFIVTNELNTFAESLANFKRDKTSLEKAETACLDSRLALATLLQYEYVRPEHRVEVTSFLDGLKELKQYMWELSEKLETGNERERIQEYARSVKRRIGVMSALLNYDPVEAHNIMLAAKQ